jgi:hypothetical protein
VSLSASTFDSRIGPKESIAARMGTASPAPARLRNSTGKPAAAQSSPVSAARWLIRSPGSPGAKRPVRSPLTSGISTGTPAVESCSAITCSVLVFPVPVAPATRPCRLNIASGIRTSAVGSATPSITTDPSVTLAAVVS